MPRRLHIGGTEAREGWEVLNIQSAPYVDHLGDAADLSRFEEDTFSEIYASHIIEHFDYAKLDGVLREWKRVLQPGGVLYLSTPDLDILTALFTMKDRLSFPDRYQLMRIIFGGHMNDYDFHQGGFNQEILGQYLLEAGYAAITKIEKLTLFNDTSQMVFKGVPISLNMTAEKPAR